MKMILSKDGIQYRQEDAERLGITGTEFDSGPAGKGRVIRAGDPANATGGVVGNKSRTINTAGTQKTAAEKKAATEKAAAEVEGK